MKSVQCSDVSSQVAGDRDLGAPAVRSFAMGYNRLADLDIDRLNPRTQMRPLVTGELSVAFTKRFLFVCALVFTAACAAINTTCLLLSPVALVWSAFYSHTKRFTPLCHFALGRVKATP